MRSFMFLLFALVFVAATLAGVIISLTVADYYSPLLLLILSVFGMFLTSVSFKNDDRGF